MPEKIEIQPIMPDDNMIEATPAELASYAAAHGHVLTLARDGKLFRILDPWDPGEPTEGTEAARR